MIFVYFKKWGSTIFDTIGRIARQDLEFRSGEELVWTIHVPPIHSSQFVMHLGRSCPWLHSVFNGLVRRIPSELTFEDTWLDRIRFEWFR